MAHFDLNVITVGGEAFSAAKRTQLELSIRFLVSVYAGRGPQVDTINRFNITRRLAGSLINVGSGADAIALADRFGVPNDALDVLVLETFLHPLYTGFSPVRGSCAKSRTTRLRTPVVSLDGDAAESGNTFAHEIGHFLGLSHCEVDPSMCNGPRNFMTQKSNSNTSMTAAQSVEMKRHCLMKQP